MTRIIEHRSALPFGRVVEVHVRHDPNADPAVYATINVSVFGQNPNPDAFPQALSVAEAFLQAIAYAERGLGSRPCGLTIQAAIFRRRNGP